MDELKQCLDKLFISNLRTRCIVGIKPEERENLQDVVLNIELFVDLQNACMSDDLGDTLDYSTLKKDVLQLVESSSFFLIEKLAQEVAELCMSQALVKKVRVRLEKPTALRFADSVGVEIIRSRN